MRLLNRIKDWIASSVDTRLVGSVLRWFGFLYRPLDDRLRPREAVARAWRAPIYRGLGWLHVLGPAALFLVFVLAGTGILLAFHYEGHPDTSRTSVLDVTAETPGGWLIRGVHHWAAQLLVALVVLHAVHAFFSRAYRAPRQANWVIGLLILPIVFALHFSGTVLPWDHDAYWCAAKTLKLGAGLPIIGGFFQHFAEESQLSNTTLGRAFALHVVLLPWTLFFLLTIHLRLIWRHGLTPPMPARGGDPADDSMLAVLRADTTVAEAAALRADIEAEAVGLRQTELEGRTIFHLEGCRPALAEKLSRDPRVKEVVGVSPGMSSRAFYPRHFLRIAGALLAICGALVLLAAWLPPSIRGPADSFHPPTSTRIPWYTLWFQGLRDLVPSFAGTLLVLLGLALLFFIPMIDKHDGGRPRRPWLAWAVGAAGLLTLIALSFHGAGRS